MRDLRKAPVWPIEEGLGDAGPIPSVCYLLAGQGAPRYVDVREHAAQNGGRPVLLCDPLTGLLAYDSFAQHVTSSLAGWLERGAHMAIGDVDGLKEYVTRSNTADPKLFGHLAGNQCMKLIGAIVRGWSAGREGEWAAMVCGTFGGDEVIVVAVGGRPADFVRDVEKLADDIRRGAPRPCSFACVSVGPTPEPLSDPGAFYAEWVGTVDRALFEIKSSGRTSGGVHPVELRRRP